MGTVRLLMALSGLALKGPSAIGMVLIVPRTQSPVYLSMLRN